MNQGKDDLSRYLFDYIPEPIFLLDAKGFIRYGNAFVVKLLDMDIETIIGKKFFDFIDTGDVARVKKAIKIFLNESDSSLFLSYCFQLPSGGKIPVTSTLRDLSKVQGINGILLILRDVTAEKNLEKDFLKIQQKLKKSIQQVQFINENTLDFIFQVKLTGEFTYVTSASRLIAGYEPDEMIGKKWMDYVPKMELIKYLTKVKEMLSGKKITDFQTFVIHKEGHLVPVEFSGTAVKKNKKIYINGVMRDLSNRIESKQQLEKIAKNLEAEVKERKEELEELHGKFLESEAKYKTLFMNLPDGAGVTDEYGEKIIDINAALASRFRKTPEELIGKNSKVLLPENIFHERYQYVRKAIETNMIQCHIDQREGMSFQTYYVPITMQNGDKYALFVSRDITTLKEQEKEIRKNEERYRLLFEHANEAICVAQDRYLKLINPKFIQMLGYTQDTIYHTPFIEFIHPDDRTLVFNRYQERLAGNQPPAGYDFRVINKSGNIRWIQINAVFFTWDGKPATLNFISDITDRKRVEEDLRESEEQFRTVTASAQDGIIMIDDDGNIVLWNQSAEKMFGYEPEELKGKPVHTLLASSTQQKRYLDSFEGFRKSGKGSFIGKIVELKAYKKGKISFPIELSLSSVKLKKRWHAIAFARDISERKELEKNLLQSYKILEKRVEERTFELKQSEKRYRDLFEFAPVGIGISNFDGRVVDANRNMLQIMGFSSLRDLKKINIKDLYVNIDDRTRLLMDLESKGHVRNFLVQLKRKDGTMYHCLLDIDVIDREGEKFLFTTVRDITEMINTQRDMAETRDFLQNVINSASEFIMTVDASMNITMWNKTAIAITGYHRTDVVGKSIKDCTCFENASVLVDYIKSTKDGHTVSLEDIIINSKSSEKRVIRFSSSKIHGGDKEVTGFLFVGYDISSQSKIHGKLLQGSSYLILDESLKLSVDLFVDLQMKGYAGLFFSRGNPTTLKNLMSPLNTEMYIFNEESLVKTKTIVSLDEIYMQVERFLKQHDVSVLLFDRIDYLIILYSFQEVLHFLYKVNSLISGYNTILLLHLNPDLLDGMHLSYLKQEFQMLPVKKVDTMKIDAALYDILVFVNEQNQQNILVSFQKIGNYFSISKVTTQKRVYELESKGLVGVKLMGRSKTVFVTRSGEILLHRRAVV